MGTQNAIAKQIKETQADYILTLKRNHPSLAEEAHNWFENNREKLHSNETIFSHNSCEAGHHRLEKRRFWQDLSQRSILTGKNCTVVWITNFGN